MIIDMAPIGSEDFLFTGYKLQTAKLCPDFQTPSVWSNSVAEVDGL